MATPIESMMNVLSALMSPDNAARKAAEAYFSQELQRDCMSTIQIILNIFSNAAGNVDYVLRDFSGVLLRRAVEKAQFPPEHNAELRGILITLWKNESNTGLLKRLAHVMAQSAMNSSWVDLLPQVVGNVSSQLEAGIAPESVVSPALLLVEVVAEYCPQDILTHMQVLGGFLSSQLGSPAPAIQVSCAKCTGACIVALEDDAAREAFKPAIQPIIGILGAALNRGDETDASAITAYLVAIAEVQPIFFKGNLDAVVAAMLSVAQTEALDFPTRSIALELMVTLTESAPALTRRCAGLINGLVPLAMSIMLDVDETEAEWAGQSYADEPQEENYYVGEEAIERTAAGMGCRTLAPPLLAQVQAFAGNPDWAHRRAAVAGLCRLAEGSSAQFIKNNYFEQSLAFLNGALSDSSPRVRYEALQTLGRFAVLFPQQLEKLVTQFVPTVTAILGDVSACDRVRGHATAALINLTNPEYCESEMLTNSGVLEPLLRTLAESLQNTSAAVQPFCLDLLGCVAHAAEDAFAPYYSSFMPGIKSIMVSTRGNPELAKLRGKAIRAVGLVGEAVGASVFTADAQEVLGILMADVQGSAATQDMDDAFEYVLPACVRISKALGASFEPYMQLVMPPLLHGAAQVITCTVEDAEEGDAEGEAITDEETGLESAVIAVQGMRKRVTMNTHAVQQKVQSARMLLEFAGALKGNMKTFLLPALEVVLPMVTDKHSHDVRSNSSLAVAKLFEATVDAVKLGFLDPNVMSSVLEQSINKLLESLKGEINVGTRACSADSLFDILNACYTSGQEQPDGTYINALVRPDAANTAVICEELMLRCGDSVTSRTEQERAFAANEGLEAEDHEAFAEQQEEEEEVLSSLANGVGSLLKLHQDSFALMPLFDAKIAPAFATYLEPGNGHCDHFQIVACSMMDDAIEFGGPHVHKYLPVCIRTFVHNVTTTENMVLRQCSAYGLAQMLRLHPDAVLASMGGDVSPVLNSFIALISRGDAKEEDNEGVTENAVFGLGVMVTLPNFRACVQNMRTSVGSLTDMTKMWLQNMPLRSDELSSKISSHALCNSIEQLDPAILGEQYSNLSAILRIFAEIFIDANKNANIPDEDKIILAQSDTMSRIVVLVKAMAAGTFNGVTGPVMSAAYGVLSAEQQHVLSTL